MEQWIIAIAQNLLAMMIGSALVQWWASGLRPSKKSVIGVAKTATKIMYALMWNFFRHVLVLTVLFSMIRSIVEAPGIISRLEAALLAFWVTVWWHYFAWVFLQRNWDKPELKATHDH